MEIRYREARSRWELLEDDEVIGVADRVDQGDVVVLPHVEVDASRRGQGLAAQLTASVLDELRAEGRRVVPRCSYVAAFVRRHPEYQDLTA